MTRYNLPESMRYSTLEERREFYRKEFDLSRVEEWFGNDIENVVFAVIMGRHTGVYLPEYKEDASTTILIDEYKDLNSIKEWTLEFLPEAVYYDRNIYDGKGKVLGQQIAFDIDPENLDCPLHGTLEDKMRRGQGLSVCEIELRMVKDETIRLYEELTDTFFRMRIVYSGRGYHIHVFDEESFKWSLRSENDLLRK